jgi:hypothetical protein
MSIETVICTASNKSFSSLLVQLLQSIRTKPRGGEVAIGVLDLGLPADKRAEIDKFADHIVEPVWDFSFPLIVDGVPRTADEKFLANNRGYMAMTARPFLNDHFPGYKTYIWIDADCWLQDWTTMEWLIDGAADGSLCIVPEMDRSYVHTYDHGAMNRWFNKNIQAFFGKETARQMWNFPLLNSGVFALLGNSPLWTKWRAALSEGLHKATDFYAEQFGLNKVVYGENFPRKILPATCNWLVNRGQPLYDAENGLFVEPNPPYRPLGIVHLSGDSKSKVHNLRALRSNRILQTHLRYDPKRYDLKVKG